MGLELLQRQRRAVVWVPSPPKVSAVVLARLERQNSGLSTAGWRVHAENVGASQEERTLVLGIVESS